MPRKPATDQQEEDDSAILHEAIQGIIDAQGRGGLSYVARRLGVTPSMLQKRLKVPGKAFDATTLRAAALVIEHAQEAQPPERS